MKKSRSAHLILAVFAAIGFAALAWPVQTASAQDKTKEKEKKEEPGEAQRGAHLPGQESGESSAPPSLRQASD